MVIPHVTIPGTAVPGAALPSAGLPGAVVPGAVVPGLIVLSGLTASGKTELLHALAAGGEQTIDLEDLAGHRGSAFGNLGGTTQPRHAAFQLAVRTALAEAAPSRPIWVEDEGDYIGSVGLPAELIAAIRTAPCVEVTEQSASDAVADARVARIVREYGRHGTAAWLNALTRVAPRLGGTRAEAVRAALGLGDIASAVRELLPYYDAGYRHRIAALARPVLGTVTAGDAGAALALAAGAGFQPGARSGRLGRLAAGYEPG